MRLDRKAPMNEPCALAHAHEPKRGIGALRVRIEADTIIVDGEAKLAVVHYKVDSRRRRAAVFVDVVQSLLRNAIEAKRRVLRYSLRHRPIAKLDSQLMRQCEFFAKPA